ncbi:thioredoxin family protein [candidate division KSB1 bacterium]|nr:thioredoxin family protein [candidate division KSB1 bacterium]
MSQEIVKIIIGNQRIGIAGLKEIFDAIKSMQLHGDASIRAILLEKVKRSNYVSPSMEKEYADALLKFYKKSIGIQVEDDVPAGITFYILGPGCPACDQIARDILSILVELNMAANVEHIRDINEIANFGMIRTPAVVMNKKIILSGRTIPRLQLKELLLKEIKQEHQS